MLHEKSSICMDERILKARLRRYGQVLLGILLVKGGVDRLRLVSGHVGGAR